MQTHKRHNGKLD